MRDNLLIFDALMGKNRTTNHSGGENANAAVNLDARDMQILELLLAGHDNKEIAGKLKIPMSTVQRRTRQLFEDGIVKNKVELNYKKLGFRSGLLHVYLKNGNINGIAAQVSAIRGIQSTTIHIGNSDVVGGIIYKDSADILKAIAGAKRIEGVERVVWSEEVIDVVKNGNKNKTLLDMLQSNPVSRSFSA